MTTRRGEGADTGGPPRAATVPSLRAGAPGKAGLLDLTLGPVRDRTRVLAATHRVPLHVLRAHHHDAAEPSMAYVTVVSPVGGVAEGDRLTVAVRLRAGGAAHITTAAATNVYTMRAGHARARTTLAVEAGAYLEFIPEPLIPHRGARYRQQTRLLADPAGCLLYGEVLLAGRSHMGGEAFAYHRLDLSLEGARPDGRRLFADRLLLEPARRDPSGVGRFGAGRRALVTLVCLCPAAAQRVLGEALADAVTECPPGVLAGASELPAGAGVMARGLAPDAPEAGDLLRAWWAAARGVLRGTSLPERRRP